MNLAQKLLVALGADQGIVLFGHSTEKQRTYTKKGPGRRCDRSPSHRTETDGELGLYGNKIARKFKRGL